MRLRLLTIAAIAAALPLSPLAAQFWNNQPTYAAQDPGTAAPPPTVEPESSAAAPPSSSLATPPTGRMTSLGGSGATGPDSVGTLPERDTGFDRKTWRDTDFALVLQLLDRLPERIDSAAEHNLARNLLVSVGEVPPGDDGDSQMLVRRVRKLIQLGDVEDAAALARAAPGLPRDKTLAHAEIDAELLAGQIEAACIDLRAFGAILTDPASATALLLCRQRAGETIEGGLPPVDAASLGPFARIAGAPLGVDPLSAPPARLVAAARDKTLSADQRLEAAFAAGRASAITGEALAKIFHAAQSSGGEPSGDTAPANAMEAAALFHAIEQTGDTGLKLSLAQRGLLSPGGIADKVGVAMASPLRNLQPVSELGAMAPRFALIFYTIGDVDAASPWADLAEQAGTAAPIWPFRVLLGEADKMGIAAWEQQDELDPARRARILTILSAFDVTAPPPASTRIEGDDQAEPSFTDLLAMDQAAKDLHVGETVLRALALLGSEGPAYAHPLALRRALADLDAVHMHAEAHALAFEAIAATLRGH